MREEALSFEKNTLCMRHTFALSQYLLFIVKMSSEGLVFPNFLLIQLIFFFFKVFSLKGPI